MVIFENNISLKLINPKKIIQYNFDFKWSKIAS